MGRLHKSVRAGCLMIAVGGCMSWHNPKLTPSALIEERHPKAVLVKRQDNSELLLFGPSVAGDSLFGTHRRKPMAIPLSEVSSVSVQAVNGGLTVLGVLMIGVVIAMAVAASTITIFPN